MSPWSFQMVKFSLMFSFSGTSNSAKNCLVLSALDHCYVLYCLQLTKIIYESCYQLFLLLLLLLLLNCKKKRKRQLCACTEWNQHMWHSDRNNNNALTEQPALGGWKLSSTHNIQQQWQSTKAGIQFEQQWLQQWQQNLLTERWQMIQEWTVEDLGLAETPKRANKVH